MKQDPRKVEVNVGVTSNLRFITFSDECEIVSREECVEFLRHQGEEG